MEVDEERNQPAADEDENLTIASQVPFHDFAMVCERVTKTQGKEKKKELVRKFLTHWRSAHQKMHGTKKTTDSFFPALRLLLPQLDKERPAYGMKEVVLAKYYIEVLGLSKESTDAQKLLNYRAPSSAKQDAGDFASVAYVVLKSRCPDKGSLFIKEVNDSLDGIAHAYVEKRRDQMKATIQRLVRSTSALEQKWLIRILLKEMKLGLNENSIFPIFHSEAMELFNVCNSLSKVCLDLHDPETKLNETEISLFTPFRPMLGQRVVIDEVEKLMNNVDFIVETKIDGERMQMHKNDEEFRYFSRNSNDYSENFGTSRYRGTLTPFICNLFKPEVKTCILDGEMVGYDPELQDFALKGSNIDVKSDSLSGVHPCFVVFDVLMVNGENLVNVALSERIKRMDGLLDICKGRMEIVERKIGRSKDDIVNAINQAVDRREEGIVIKDPSSTYKPSKRKGSGWLKLKPEYVDSLGDDLDLIIIGGEYGSGHRRGGMISHFLLGVAVTPETTGDRPKQFMTFGKVGSGYSDKELKCITDQLNPHWKKFDVNKIPPSLLFTNGFKEKPDVIIEPKDSLIVQVKASEITYSGKYKCQCTMRFPRVERIRDDKAWYDCMTFEELEEMKRMADGKLAYKQANDGESGGEPSKKKRRTVTRIERPRTVAEHFKGADVSEVTEISKLFEEKELCILNGPSNFSKQALEKKLHEYGGTFVQNPTCDTKCVVADKLNVRVKNIISRGNIDVVKATWLIRCFEQNQFLPYKPGDMHFTTEDTKKSFQRYFDMYGDSFTEDVEPSKLRNIFSAMDDKKEKLSTQDILDIDQRFFPNDSVLGLFRRCRLLLWKDSNDDIDLTTHVTEKNLDFFAMEFRFYGGVVVSDLSEASHILVSKRTDEQSLNVINDQLKGRRFRPHVITGSWIQDSIDAKKTLSERPYQPP